MFFVIRIFPIIFIILHPLHIILHKVAMVVQEILPAGSNRFSRNQTIRQFFIRKCRIWNTLADELKLSETLTLSSFKSLIFKYKFTSLINCFSIKDQRTWKNICPNCNHPCYPLSLFYMSMYTIGACINWLCCVVLCYVYLLVAKLINSNSHVKVVWRGKLSLLKYMYMTCK